MVDSEQDNRPGPTSPLAIIPAFDYYYGMEKTTPSSQSKRFITRRTIFRIAAALFVLGVVAALVLGGLVFWYFNRARPEPVTDQPLFQGITYTREIHNDPRPYILHMVRIDLDAPGLGFIVTPGGGAEGFDYAARTTSQFLTEFNAQIAINGDFFDPLRDNRPWDYYPHTGDGVNVRGLTASRGQIVTGGFVPSDDYATLFISEDNRASFNAPEDAPYNALSGRMLMVDGAFVESWSDNMNYSTGARPRTAVALSEDEQTLLLIVVDGRQPNYSEGVTLPELADIILRHGGYHALTLDGGGSSTLVRANSDGSARELNSPIHTRMPGRQRPVANHLGVFAQP